MAGPISYGSRGTYVLDGQTPVLVQDVPTWADWMENTDRRIAHTEFHTPAQVTLIRTDFIGLDIWIHGVGPFYFVTVTVTGEERCLRYAASWSEAEAVHLDVVDTVKAKYRGTSG